MTEITRYRIFHVFTLQVLYFVVALLEDLLKEDELLSVLGLPHPKLAAWRWASSTRRHVLYVPFDDLSFDRNTFYQQQLLDLTKLTLYFY